MEDVKEVTLEELAGFIQSQKREFIIHVELRKGDEDGDRRERPS